MPQSVRRTVRASTDLNQLQRWRDRAYEVNEAEQLFVDDVEPVSG
ncbi:hypothetical protein [Streptomyces sp. HYC2]|nr:hypothetical protein [Streptomyces sp. HYC2]